MNWILLLGLPLIIGLDGQTEIPKVIVFEILVVGMFLWHILKKKLELPKIHIIILAYSLFSLITVTTENLLGNPFRLQGIFLIWILILWSAIAKDYSPKPPKIVVWSSLILIVISGLVIGANEAGRAIGTLGEPNALAAVSIFLWPFAGVSAIVLTILVVIISHSVSAFVALVIQVITYFVYRSKYKKYALLVGVTLWLLSLSLPLFEKNILWENRIDVWKTALNAGLSKPILGWGFGNLTQAIEDTAVKIGNIVQYQYVDSAHNIFLDWWIQGGLVGLGLLVISVGTALRKYQQSDPVKLIALLGLIIVLSFNPLSVVTLMHFWWLIGMAVV